MADFKDTLLWVLVVLFAFVAFGVFGSMAKETAIKRDCAKIGMFVIDGVAYDCKERKHG